MDLFVLDKCYKVATLSIACGMFRNKKAKWERHHYTPHEQQVFHIAISKIETGTTRKPSTQWVTSLEAKLKRLRKNERVEEDTNYPCN
ncbi:hypothetical protein MKW98_005831 [Papaver atlanticum]|uniref:Uncharacterized protein n=1 Tax=Papaver atlanticum TaxID=357466 RepID=A0AAD4XSP8_9MAGN|nr:hypothetical protein MKW98_005831 [Papaver atlanticum]